MDEKVHVIFQSRAQLQEFIDVLNGVSGSERRFEFRARITGSTLEYETADIDYRSELASPLTQGLFVPGRVPEGATR